MWLCPWLYGGQILKKLLTSLIAQYWPVMGFFIPFWPRGIYWNNCIEWAVKYKNTTLDEGRMLLQASKAYEVLLAWNCTFLHTLVFMLCHGWFYTENLCGSFGQENFFFPTTNTTAPSFALRFLFLPIQPNKVPPWFPLLRHFYCHVDVPFLIVMGPSSIILSFLLSSSFFAQSKPNNSSSCMYLGCAE